MRLQTEIDKGERIIVGVNAYQGPDGPISQTIKDSAYFVPPAEARTEAVTRVKKLRETRDQSKTVEALTGGVMDNLLAQNALDEIPDVVAMIRDHGMLAGIAGHNPKVFEWAEEHLDVDFYMCSYYNSAHRDERAEHVSGMKEWFLDEDRTIMTDLIQRLSRPAIHYKVMAAGRNDPRDALSLCARAMRPSDAVCVGVYPKDKPDMLAEDARLLETALASTP